MTVIALLCALALSSADCNRSTAIDFMRLGEAPNAIQCLMGAQMTLAQLAIRADAAHRWIIKCEPPTSIGKDTVG